MTTSLTRYSKKHVDSAGKVLCNSELNPENFNEAIELVDYWRAAHVVPLRACRSLLTTRAKSVDKTCDVVQRLKRLPAIVRKLQEQPNMKLTQMQDIGGCRAIVRDVRSLTKIMDVFRERRHKHQLSNVVDYIGTDQFEGCPRTSGYRGVHLILKCNASESSANHSLRVELQLRTRRQHAWATAVETVELFIGENLKSDIGHGKWQRFFALMGSVFAIREGLTLVPGTPSALRELIDEVRHYAEELAVVQTLRNYRNTLRITDSTVFRKAKYVLLSLAPSTSELRYWPYDPTNDNAASAAYFSEESVLWRPADQPVNRDIVLVNVDSIRGLKRAFPNYFADTRRFVAEVEMVVATKTS